LDEEAGVQHDIKIAAGIEARQIEAITTSVLDFRRVLIRAVSS